MRALILVCVAASLACGSGSKDATSGGGGPTRFTLRMTTTGNGLVRGAGTDCRGSCTAQFVAGSPIHLVAVPDSGASFVGWAGSCGGSGACDVTLDADRDVSATFAAAPPPPQGKHRLVVVVQGKGRVTSSPAGLDCDSSTCGADFDSGASVTLSATPATGFSFSGWGSDCSGRGGCTVMLSKEATVFANFVPQTPPPPPQVHLRVSASGRGTVTGAGLSCGEGASTCDVLVTSGSAVTLTATGGTGARFMGWGGPCSGTASTCGFTVQSDTDVTAEFQSEVVALAPNDGTNGMVIALNSTHVFWPRFGSAGNGIWTVPKNGGAAVKVAGGFANAIVADDAFLYWTDGSNVYSTPVGGGEVALLASAGTVGKLALDEVGALYWVVTASGDLTGSVHRMQDRFDSVLARGENPNGPIAVDATHVYFTGNRAGGFIRRVPRKGGEVETVLDCGSRCFPGALRVDSRFIYFRVFTAAPSGQVEAFNKADGSLRVISGGNDPGGLGDVNQSGADVDVNDFVVYWNWSGGKSPYGIFRANADGTGFAAVDSSEDIGWLALRVDDRAVYYLHSGAIIRRLK